MWVQLVSDTDPSTFPAVQLRRDRGTFYRAKKRQKEQTFLPVQNHGSSMKTQQGSPGRLEPCLCTIDHMASLRLLSLSEMASFPGQGDNAAALAGVPGERETMHRKHL